MREVNRLVDDPEGDLLLLGSLKDRDSADPSYFNQSYLGPWIAFLLSLALLSSPWFFCALLFRPLCLDPIINNNTYNGS